MMSAVAPSFLTPAAQEATRKARAVWVALNGAAPQLLWHLWHDRCLWLVCNGGEQAVPAAATATRAVVTVRVKEGGKGPAQAVLQWQGTVARVPPEHPLWAEVIPLLHEQRRNPPDGEQQPVRWARESVLLQITPD